MASFDASFRSRQTARLRSTDNGGSRTAGGRRERVTSAWPCSHKSDTLAVGDISVYSTYAACYSVAALEHQRCRVRVARLEYWADVERPSRTDDLEHGDASSRQQHQGILATATSLLAQQRVG